MQRPHLSNVVFEIPRTLKHFTELLLHKQKPNIISSSIPVMVIPGFLAGDWSTKHLRKYLTHQGFTAYGWNQGMNKGFSFDILRNILSRIETISKEHNSPVIVIGWSLGGLYAREISRLTPNVSKIVTLGSPFGNIFANYLTDIYQIITNNDMKQLKTIAIMLRRPLTKPNLNIYTKKDGVVHWTSCFLESDNKSINIEVFSSHTGLGYDVNVYKHIVNFLNYS